MYFPSLLLNIMKRSSPASFEKKKFVHISANDKLMEHEQVPCRTAMRGSFPLNGTYFQVNEV